MAYIHPRITNTPGAAHEWAAMAAEAADCVARREASYPALVETDKMPPAEANADLAAWRSIAADWHWIATGEGQPATRDTLPARIVALDTAIARFFAAMDRKGGSGRLAMAERQQITCLAAMREWAQIELLTPGKLHARDYAAIGHEWRQRNGHPTLGAMRAAQEGHA